MIHDTEGGGGKSLARPAEKTLERSPFFVGPGGHCCRGDLIGRTTFRIFLSGLQKLDFGRCSFFASWSGLGLISTPVLHMKFVYYLYRVFRTFCIFVMFRILSTSYSHFGKRRIHGIYSRMYVFMYVCTMYVCMYVLMYVLCMYVCMCVCVCVYVRMYLCMYVCMYYVCMYVCIYVC